MYVNIFNNDCLIEMDNLEDNSVDLVICDLPYGVTKAEHDVVIPMNDFVTEVVRGKPTPITLDEFLIKSFKKGNNYKESLNYFNENKEDGLWTKYHRVVKENGAIILFSQDKFSAYLMNSNPKEHRYNLIWEKLGQPTGFLNANKMPLRSHEDILIFYKKPPTYNPQKVKGKPNNSRGSSSKPLTNNNYGSMIFVDNRETLGDMKHPKSILSFHKPHPPVFATQKSVELCEWLIKSYSNEGDTVLDNCMGSGTTGIACINTNRNFVGIEKNPDNYILAEKRIEQVYKSKGGNYGDIEG